MKRSVVLFLLLMMSSAIAWAQNSESYLNDVGSTAYGINIPVENGFINVSNGNLHLEFPFASHPQRGSLRLHESLVYDSRIWMFSSFGTHGSYHWWPYNVNGTSSTAGGWRFLKGNEVGTPSFRVISSSNNPCDDTSGYDSTWYSEVVWTDPQGVVHPFNAYVTGENNQCSNTYTQSISAGSAADGSGYQASDDGTGNPLITDNSGTEVYPQVIDRYGNYWSTDGNGNLVDDTGRTPVIVTQNGNETYYDVLAPNGTTFPNEAGTRVRYTVTTASVPVETYFSQPDTYEWNLANKPNYLTPVQSILLPDGVSQYTFGYDGYGGLNSVTLPTGGVIQYGYSNFLDSSSTENRWLTSRTVGSNPAMTFTPKIVTKCQNYSTGCIENVTLHKPSGDETVYQLTMNNGNWNTQVTTYTGPSTSGTLLAKTTNTNTYANGCDYAYQCVGANYLSQSLATTALYASPGSTQTPTVYSQNLTSYNVSVGKISDEKDWDYVTSSPSTATAPSGTPTRETKYTYTGLDPYQVTVLDSAGNQAAQTTYGYTSSATVTSGVAQHGSQNASGPYLQTVSHSINTGGTATTTYTMDDTGMVTGVADANGNPASSLSYQCSNSLLYQNTNPISQMTQYTYDCQSGAIQSAKDPNDLANKGSGTTYKYESAMGRIYNVTRPDGGSTTYSYPSITEVDTTTTATPSPSISSSSISDSFGRPYQSIKTGTEVDTSYDVNGRPDCISNPYSQGGTSSGSTCMTSYDGLDRPLAQSKPDGSTLGWSYSSNTTYTTNENSATWTRTVDSFGRLISVAEPGPSGALTTNYSYDGLGNTTKINQLGNAGNGDSPRVRTFTYDSASRLICASQPETSQNSCPTSATGTIPSGVMSYSYYPAGNVQTKTDARGVTVTYGYDKGNRLISKAYSGKAPAGSFASCYQYDTGTNGIGRLGFVWTQSSNCPSSPATTPPASGSYQSLRTFGAYDAMGRVTSEQQCVLGYCTSAAPPSTPTSNCASLSSANGVGYCYDLAGNILAYSNGLNSTAFPQQWMLFSQQFDSAGRLTSATCSNGACTANYSLFSATQSNSYTPFNALQNWQLGTNLSVSKSYDNRLRPTGLAAVAF